MKDAWRDLTCPVCRGTGIFKHKKAVPCIECHGTGRINLEEDYP